MADPRNVVDYVGVDVETITGRTDGATIVYNRLLGGGSAAVGKAVTLSADGTFALAADADSVIGKLLIVEWDGQATVQNSGGCVLPGGNGATLTRGTAIVGALDAGANPGFIRSAVAAESPKSRHEIMANADPTKVQVMLNG